MVDCILIQCQLTLLLEPQAILRVAWRVWRSICDHRIRLTCDHAHERANENDRGHVHSLTRRPAHPHHQHLGQSF